MKTSKESNVTEKASNIQVGGNHYKSMPIQPSEFCQRNGLNWCESNAVKYVARHRSKNGVEDIKKAIHYLNLLMEWEYPPQVEDAEPWDMEAKTDTPPAREPLDLRLPSYALPCTAEEARAQWDSERCEYRDSELGSFLELIEAWDILQAANTWAAVSKEALALKKIDIAQRRLERLHSEGRPVARAGRAMLIKNAARGYYSHEDCARILADV